MLRGKFNLRAQDPLFDVMSSECLKLTRFVQSTPVIGDLDVRDYKRSVEDLHQTVSLIAGGKRGDRRSLRLPKTSNSLPLGGGTSDACTEHNCDRISGKSSYQARRMHQQSHDEEQYPHSVHNP